MGGGTNGDLLINRQKVSIKQKWLISRELPLQVCSYSQQQIYCTLKNLREQILCSYHNKKQSKAKQNKQTNKPNGLKQLLFVLMVVWVNWGFALDLAKLGVGNGSVPCLSSYSWNNQASLHMSFTLHGGGIREWAQTFRCFSSLWSHHTC